MKATKLKIVLLIGIILLVLGILLNRLFQMDVLGLILICTGVAVKLIYILKKVKSGEYKPGKELIFLVIGLVLFFTGLYLQNINQTLINPIYLIVVGLILKVIFIIKFIRIVQSERVLSSMADKLSDVIPNSITSPIIEEIGAIVGIPTPDGKFSHNPEPLPESDSLHTQPALASHQDQFDNESPRHTHGGAED